MSDIKVSKIQSEQTLEDFMIEASQGVEQATGEDVVDDYFETAFGEPTGGSQSSSAGMIPHGDDPIYDYTFGIYTPNGIASNSSDAASGVIFDDIKVPDYDTLRKDNPKVDQYTELAKTFYKDRALDIEALKKNYVNLIKTNLPLNSKLELQTRIEKCDLLLNDVTKNLDRVNMMTTQNEQIHLYEKMHMIDSNGDGIIGAANKAGSYYVYEKDGKKVFVDVLTKQPVKVPFLDTGYEPTLSETDCFNLIDDPAKAYSNSNGDIIKKINGEYISQEMGAVDAFLQINPDATKAGKGYFDTFADILLPEVVYVKKNKDVDGDSLYATKTDESGAGGAKMIAKESWTQDADGKIYQIPPDETELDEWVPVRIDHFQVESVESGLQDKSGGDLYHHYLIGRVGGDQGDCAVRVRIEGPKTGTDCNQAVETKSEDKRAMASQFSLGLDAKRRSANVSIDTTLYKTNVRHVVDDFEKALGGIPDEVKTNKEAFQQTESFFTKKSEIETTYYEGKCKLNTNMPEGWVSANYEDLQTEQKKANWADYNNTGSSDIFISDNFQELENVNTGSVRFGMAINNVRGYIKMADGYSNICKSIGANKYTEWEKEILPPDIEKIKVQDAEAINIVDAGSSGQNVVLASSHARNFINNVVMAIATDDDGYGDFNIAVQEEELSAPSDGKYPRNPRIFAHLTCKGDVKISNSNEETDSETGAATNSEPKKDPVDDKGTKDIIENANKDDWYFIDAKRVGANMPSAIYDSETNVIHFETDAPDYDTFMADIKEIKQQLIDSIMQNIDVDEAEINDDLDMRYENETALAAEMDTFFGDMFGEMGDLWNEFESLKQY